MLTLTIIIPHHNHNDNLLKLLDSILSQTLRDLEVIVVDDCSGERCDSLVASYKAKGLDIRLIQNTTRRYTKDCRLIGVEASRGQIIAFADADDSLWGIEALEHHVRLFLETDADIVHFPAMESTLDGNSPFLRAYSLPFADNLYGSDIFAASVEKYKGAPTLWNKLWSKRLWNAVLPLAKETPPMRYGEDVYLASLLFFHAKTYIGSNIPGYHYFFKKKWHEKRAGRIATFSHILRTVVPYFTAHADKAENVTRYAKQIRQLLRRELIWHFSPERDLLRTLESVCISPPPSSKTPLQIVSVDRSRKRLKTVCLSPHEQFSPQFVINNVPHDPVSHYVFPFPGLETQSPFLHIFGLSCNEAFSSLEVRVIDGTCPVRHGGKTATRLSAADLPPVSVRPHRRFRQQTVALLARSPFIRKMFAGCWLLADNGEKTEESIEHFYRWLKREHPDQKIVLALNRTSRDWERLKREGFHLVDIRSLWYCFAWIHCTWLISPQAADYIRKLRWRQRYADLISHKFCFLKHNFAEDDLRGLVPVAEDVFVTATGHGNGQSFAENAPPAHVARETPFFPFNGQNNCQRVYDAICKLSAPAGTLSSE